MNAQEKYELREKCESIRHTMLNPDATSIVVTTADLLRLLDENARLIAMCKKLEYCGKSQYPNVDFQWCPVCFATDRKDNSHISSCPLSALLRDCEVGK